MALNLLDQRCAVDSCRRLHGDYFREAGAEALPRRALVGEEGGSVLPNCGCLARTCGVLLHDGRC